jgi:hypothetical protein
MPFIQQRAISLVESGLFYMRQVNDARRTIERDLPIVEQEIKILEDPNTTNERKQQSIDKIWTTITTLAKQLEISQSELEFRDNLITEAKHFDKPRQINNNYRRNYMKDWRERKADGRGAKSLGKPINTTPRSNPDQQRILDELHKRLWAIEEKESWAPNEIDEIISTTVPKQSSTAILDELVASNRVTYNKATSRYEINPPPETKQ